MITTRQILDLFERRRGKALSLRDLQSAFDLDAKERKLLSRQLKQLEREGVLTRGKGSGYALARRSRSVTGTIALHRDGYGFVTVDGPDASENLFVPARFVRPAMHGDRVQVAIERGARGGRPEGHVLRVVEHAHATLVARFEEGHDVHRLVPVDPQLRETFLVPRGGEGGASDGQVVIARIETWPGSAQTATARVTEVLGAADDPAVEVRIAAEKFGLPHTFPPEVLAAAAAVPLQVREDDLAGREDLRSLPFVTIDGESAKDFDDAVAIERRPDGYRLWVAIADVAHYVPAGGVVDREALHRGTSVYFPGRCLPMLPEALSNGICSLNPAVDRLVMAAALDFDGSGRRRQSRFVPGVIHSRARLTYTTVARVLVDRDPQARSEHAALVGLLETMLELAELRISRRHERGSLDFDLPEAEIILGLRGRPEQIIRAERNIAHRLIEEFMLAANEAVAQWLEDQRVPLVFRIHEPPNEEKLAAFQEFIAHFNQGLAIPVEGIKPKLLQELLERIEGTPEEKVINHVLLRSLPQARYSVQNRGHFGLAATSYCHFTSPIRRYPDLIVHRLLRRQLALTGHDGKLPASLEEIAERSSHCERRAMEAERDIVNLKKCQYMQGRLGEEHRGFVVSVQPFGFFVELTEVFVEGLVHIASLGDDYYQYDEPTQSLTGMSRRRRFTIGDPVVVLVHRVDPERREIDFRLSGEQPPPSPRSPSPVSTRAPRTASRITQKRRRR